MKGGSKVVVVPHKHDGVFIAKAKEAGTGMDAPLVVAGGEPGEVARGQLSPVQKRGAGKRAKTCKAPCRSSLRIKNLSLR